MRKVFLLIITATVLNLASCERSDRSTKESADHDLAADSTTIKDLVKNYAESINKADTVIGAKLFAHSKEVSFIHPLGHARGWIEINKTIFTLFRETFSYRNLKTFNEHVTVYGNTAWVEFYWTFDAKFKKNDAPFQSKGRETQIWSKKNGQWNIVHVHYSGLPVANETEGF